MHLKALFEKEFIDFTRLPWIYGTRQTKNPWISVLIFKEVPGGFAVI